MLKRLYKQFLLWALEPVLEPLRADEQRVVNSPRVACENPKAIAAESRTWVLDPNGAFSLWTKP